MDRPAFSRKSGGHELGRANWRGETPTRLKSAWFAADIERLKATIAETGKAAGVSSSLRFLRKTDRSIVPRMTVAMLNVDDLMVPYFIPLDLAYNHHEDVNALEAALLKRLAEVVRSKEALTKRYRRLHTAALEAVRKIGHGARLRQLVIRPVNFAKQRETLLQREFAVEIDILGDDLRPQTVDLLSGSVTDLRFILNSFAEDQGDRAAALERRAASPGKIEVETLALELIRLSGADLRQIAALRHRYAVAGPQPFRVNGAEQTQLQFSLKNGRITAWVGFEGGYYAQSSVYLDAEFPMAVRESLPGRHINDVVQGGIFEIVNPVITGMSDMASGTCLHLDPLLQWIDV